MKLKATPLLEGPSAVSFVVDDELEPRKFVDWLDQHKVLLFQSSDGGPLTTEDFGQFLVNLQLEYYKYIGGAAPRTIIPVKASPDKDIVFTANERYVIDPSFEKFCWKLLTIFADIHQKTVLPMNLFPFITSWHKRPIHQITSFFIATPRRLLAVKHR